MVNAEIIAKSDTLRVARPQYCLHVEHIAPVDATAPWLVFGNSLVTDLSIWDAQIEEFAGRFGILRYDQAGHGRSGFPKSEVDFDNLGGDLLAIMDSASVEKAIYVGLSMGVPTGLAAHRIAADRFMALAFSDGQAKTAPGGSAGWAERIAGANETGMQKFAEVTADRWLTNASGPEVREQLVRMIAATSFEGFRACATALKDYDYEDELARINCPTLLLAGAEDGAMPEGMTNKLKPAIVSSEMHVIPQAGHVPCFEQPARFNSILNRFLDTLC